MTASSRPKPSEAAFMEPHHHAIRKFKLPCWRERTCREALEDMEDDLPYRERAHWVYSVPQLTVSTETLQMQEKPPCTFQPSPMQPHE